MRHRFDRALRILQLLQSGSVYDPVALAMALGVHRRTVYRDICVLRELGIRLVYDSQSGGYKIQARDPNADPIDQLSEALKFAMTDAQHGSSVQAMIQFVASQLAAGAKPSIAFSDPGPKVSSPVGGHANELPHSDKPRSCDSQTKTDSDVVAPQEDADREKEKTFGPHLAYRRGSGWLKTLDALQALSDAVHCGYILESSEADMIDHRSVAGVTKRLIPNQFTVTRSGVEVEGADPGGNFVRVFSVSIRILSTMREPELRVESR